MEMVVLMVVSVIAIIIIGENEKKKGWESQALPTKKMRKENQRPFNVPSSHLVKGNQYYYDYCENKKWKLYYYH